MKTGQPPIAVLIFDDTTDIREGFSSLLNFYDDIEVLASFPDANRVAEHIETYRPQVVLMDIQMPGLNGIEATAVIKTISADTEVIILTHHADDENVFKALCVGASGYLIKGTDTDIVGAIRTAYSGGSTMNSFIARKALAFFQKHMSNTGSMFKTASDYGLSKREMEVLDCLHKGHSYKEICASLHISMDTVRSHTRNIYRKLEVRSKTEAVLAAIRDKLI